MDIHNKRINLRSLWVIKGVIVKYLEYIKVPVILMSVLFLVACKLGGEVSGLEKGDSITLMEDVTGSTVAINKNGRFEFSEDFSYRSNYQVSVLKQPDSVSSCRVSNGEGRFNRDVQNVKVECEGLTDCTMQYDPVCAKQETSIVCITAPCPTHIYQTFGNACVAGLEKAAISFNDECGTLEGVVSGDSPPVRFLEDAIKIAEDSPRPVVSESMYYFPHVANVISTRFDGDDVEIDVGFSACNENVTVNMYVDPNFMESDPIQVISILPLDIKGDVVCDAYFTKTVRFDLLPLKYRYMDLYQESGVINIQGVGLYKF